MAPPPPISAAGPHASPDLVLAALARAGSDAAFTAIVERYRDPIERYCRGFLGRSDAEDAVQLTFVRALTALRRGHDVRDLRSWLYRIARNVCLSEISARQPEVDLDSAHVDRRAEVEIDRRAELSLTLAALHELPLRQRLALRWSLGGASHRTIAHELAISEAAARQLLCRARATLRAAAGAACPWWLPAGARRLAGGLRRGALVAPGAAPLPKVAVAVLAVTASSVPVAPLLRRMIAPPTRGGTVAAAHLVPRAAARTAVASPGPSSAAAPGMTAVRVAFLNAQRLSAAGAATDRRASADRTTTPGARASAASARSSGGGDPSVADATPADPAAPDPGTTDPSATDPSAAGDPNVTDTAASTDPAAPDAAPADPAAGSPDPSATDPSGATPDPSADPSASDPASSGTPDPSTAPPAP